MVILLGTVFFLLLEAEEVSMKGDTNMWFGAGKLPINIF